MPRPPTDVRDRIVSTVIRQLRAVGAGGITLAGIARETACAKGLLNYHFKTKAALVSASAESILREREEQWVRALDVASPEVAISQSWHLVSLEASSGFWRAWTSLASADKMTVRTVNIATERFSVSLGSSVEQILKHMGLIPTVTRSELGHLLAAVVQGLGLQLAAGANPAHLEGAYAALWAGLLGLTGPV